MRKSFTLFSICAAALLPATIQAEPKSVPYASTMVEGSAVSPEWTVIDNNNDCPKLTGNGCWQYDSGKLESDAEDLPEKGVKYMYHSRNAADDWIVSPPISLKAGESYKIGYWMKVSSSTNKENLTVYLTRVNPDDVTDYTAAVLADGKVLADYVDYTVNSWPRQKMFTDVFTVEEAGEYRVGFHCHSIANRYNVMVRGFEIKEDKIYPASPTDIVMQAGANDAITASLSWVNPTADTEGTPLDGSLDAIKVYRDGELVATLAGDATEWTDDETFGLTAGVHTYGVAAVFNGVESLATEIKSKWIGPIAVQTLPFTENFSDSNLFEALWTIINPDGITATSGLQPTCYIWSLKNEALAYFTPYNPIVDDDDWAITPPLNFDKPGTYQISFKACKPSGSPELTLWIGADRTAESMTTKLADVTITSNKSTPDQELAYTFDISTPGHYYIGMYQGAQRETSSQRKVLIDDLQVELIAEAQVVPLPYDTAENPDNWAAQWSEIGTSGAKSPLFAFEHGYYELSITRDPMEEPAPELEFSSNSIRIIDCSHTYHIAADDACDASVTVKNTELAAITGVAILPVDMTPGRASNLTSSKNNDLAGVNISWTLPSTTANNDPLCEIIRVTLSRDNETIEEYTQSLIPGKTMTCIDENVPNGEHVYAVTVANHSGESVPALMNVVTGNSGIDTIMPADTITDDSRMEVFTIDGRKLPSGTTLSSLARGVYILKAGGKTRKIIL